jgi:hypothetical protein
MPSQKKLCICSVCYTVQCVMISVAQTQYTCLIDVTAKSFRLKTVITKRLKVNMLQPYLRYVIPGFRVIRIFVFNT